MSYFRGLVVEISIKVAVIPNFSAIDYHHRWLWVILGWIMLIVVVAASLAPMELDLEAGGDKYAHAVAYSGLMFWFGMLYRGVGPRMALAVAFFALGAGIEFLQGATGWRTFDVADMEANAAGAVLGWGLVHTPFGRALEWLERWLA